MTVLALPYSAIAQSDLSTSSFAHLATSGGWNTSFTLVNTGTTDSSVQLEFFGDSGLQAWANANFSHHPLVGINPFAGGRWPAKELRASELHALMLALLGHDSPFGHNTHLVLLGAGDDRQRNLNLAASIGDTRITVADTDDTILRLAAIIGTLDHLITSDSLAMHLGIAQRVPFTAFFAPTSAAEIDGWGYGTHVISTTTDYCSYRKNADNSSITYRVIRSFAGQ